MPGIGRPAAAQPTPFSALASTVIPPQAGTNIIQPRGPAADNPFFRDPNGYGGRAIGDSNDPFDWEGTEISEDFAEENPEGAWVRFLASQGMNGQDRKSQWARSLYSQARAGYDAAVMSNPELSWLRYLGTLNGRLEGMWAGMSAGQKGTDLATQSKTILWG